MVSYMPAYVQSVFKDHEENDVIQLTLSPSPGENAKGLQDLIFFSCHLYPFFIRLMIIAQEVHQAVHHEQAIAGVRVEACRKDP